MINKPIDSRLPNILVVDDNHRNIVAMKTILSELPINIYEAMSGEEALKAVLRQSFAVIYLDIQMPEMDGFEVVKLLQENEKTEHIPIVLVTAIYQEESDVLSGYSAGAIDYLTKPINPAVLISKTKIFIKLYDQQHKLEDMVRKFEELANVDSLTNLPNRRQFYQVFEKIFSSSERYQRKFALLSVDLDRFKPVNDTFGHDVGDQLLVEVSKRLVSIVRRSDYVMRMGGDEFMVIISEISSSEAASMISEKILKILSQDFVINGETINVTPSIGIACYPDAATTVEGLLKSADVALYQAKKSGGNKYSFFSKEIQKKMKKHVKIIDKIHAAIRKDKIEVVYQPIIELYSNKVVAVEALSRWYDTEVGEILPEDFIPVAEELGLIPVLSHNIIKTSCDQYMSWHEELKELKLELAINLSPFQLLNKEVTHNIQKILVSTGVDCSKIQLEVTESLFNANEIILKESLLILVDLGVKLAIDDFGTGFSSLSRLKHLPIDILKIDQSFIRDIQTDPSDVAIVKAIIALGKALQIDVIAEGVRNNQQVQFLKENGCGFVQGYYFSQPLSSADMLKFLKAHAKV